MKIIENIIKEYSNGRITILNKLKALNYKIPYKFVKFYYDNQAITQIFRKVYPRNLSNAE